MGSSFFLFPSWNSRRYTQVRESLKSRHFGRDFEIQAMDGNKSVVQELDPGNLPTNCSTPFAKGVQGGLHAGTLAVAYSQSPN